MNEATRERSDNEMFSRSISSSSISMPFPFPPLHLLLQFALERSSNDPRITSPFCYLFTISTSALGITHGRHLDEDHQEGPETEDARTAHRLHVAGWLNHDPLGITSVQFPFVSRERRSLTEFCLFSTCLLACVWCVGPAGC